MFQNDETSVGASRILSGFDNNNQSKQAQINKAIELELVQERQRQIQQIESDIIDLNSMFKDVAVMVNDQQETIGSQ